MSHGGRALIPLTIDEPSCLEINKSSSIAAHHSCHRHHSTTYMVLLAVFTAMADGHP